ncbi:MAG: wcoA [Microbacteriaceae bacterium]|nr:wcoA [Microbacteriaceae bacterium]
MLAALGVIVIGVIAVILVVNRPGVVASKPAVVEPVTAAGAAELGTISYPIPKNAIFVSPNGSDQASGTEAQPLLNVQQAITIAHSGQTIVLRAGEYHQRVTITSDKTVTIQPYLKEVVWFDGSTVVSAWRQNRGVWVSDGWATQFDSSPTYKRGAPDNTEPSWIFLNPAYPLAAQPDQLWIDGKAQTQVASAAAVVPGTFAVDAAAKRLYLGSDPSGHEVRSSDKTKALNVQSQNTVLRGVGIRRYATSVPGFGTVTVEASGVTIENVLIEDNATTGLFVAAARATVRNVTVRENGMMGMGANYADNLHVTGLLATHNNTQHFNNAPVSGGFKLTKSRTVTIEKSRLSDNFGPGLWFDQSDFNVHVIANDISGNQGHGLILEISARFVLAGNLISANRDNGIKVNDTGDVQIWNNTVTANGIDLRIAQDLRRASDQSVPGSDPRQTQPDPNMTWVVGAVTVSNNVFSGATDSLVRFEDFSGGSTVGQLGVSFDGNAYQRRDASSPKALVVWPHGKGGVSYGTLKAFEGSTGQEKHGVELGRADASKASWLTGGPDGAAALRSVRTIPTSVRQLLGWDSSVRRLGAE